MFIRIIKHILVLACLLLALVLAVAAAQQPSALTIAKAAGALLVFALMVTGLRSRKTVNVVSSGGSKIPPKLAFIGLGVALAAPLILVMVVKYIYTN